jgi:predicted ester cyclase
MSAEENKAMLRRLVDALNAGNMDVMDELCTPELAAQAKQGFTAYRSEFPDWREEVVDLVAEEDKVVGRFKYSGTHRGEMMSIAPTGRRMDVDEVYFFRVENGKFVEFWGLEDNLTRMRQLGLLPPRPVAVARMLAYYAKKLGARLRQRRYVASKNTVAIWCRSPNSGAEPNLGASPRSCCWVDTPLRKIRLHPPPVSRAQAYVACLLSKRIFGRLAASY